MMIEDIVVLLATILCIAFVLWLYYKPRIEVVALVKHYRVYLTYNKHTGSAYKRVHKYLFEI